jgi:hypothetical protein
MRLQCRRAGTAVALDESAAHHLWPELSSATLHPTKNSAMQKIA